jgi:hypothetical protein
MQKTAKSRAEERFAAIQKENLDGEKLKENERQRKAAHIAKLRALRLEKEAADIEAAKKAEVLAALKKAR